MILWGSLAILGKALPTERGLAAMVHHGLGALFGLEGSQPVFGIHDCTVLMLSRCVRQRGPVLLDPTIVLCLLNHISQARFLGPDVPVAGSNRCHAKPTGLHNCSFTYLLLTHLYIPGVLL